MFIRKIIWEDGFVTVEKSPSETAEQIDVVGDQQLASNMNESHDLEGVPIVLKPGDDGYWEHGDSIRYEPMEVPNPPIDVLLDMLETNYIDGVFSWGANTAEWKDYIQGKRNVVMKRLLDLIDRYRNRAEVGIATTITSQQKTDGLLYLETLRNWPDTAIFPDDSLPDLPASISQLKSKIE